MGWLAWSWYGNGGGVEYLDLASGPAGTLSNWGNTVVNGANGTLATSVLNKIYTTPGYQPVPDGGTTPTPTPTPTPTVTPTATPTGSPTSNLALYYRAADTNATDNSIKPYFNIYNNGTTAVNLNGLKIRYYFTKDGSASLNGVIDWAQVGASNISVALGSTSGTNADSYVELTFNASAGSIPAGGQSGEIQLRVHKSDWSNFNEANDYSFDPTKVSFSTWNKVTLYQDDVLISGIAP